VWWCTEWFHEQDFHFAFFFLVLIPFNAMNSVPQNIKNKTKNLLQQWLSFPQRVRAEQGRVKLPKPEPSLVGRR
jgi:hypothetical protein